MHNWKKIKLGIKNGTAVFFNLLSNVTSDSSGKTNFPHKLSLTDTQVLRICKAFANGSSANVKFLKTKMMLSGDCLIPDPLGIYGSFSPLNISNSIANSLKN